MFSGTTFESPTWKPHPSTHSTLSTLRRGKAFTAKVQHTLKFHIIIQSLCIGLQPLLYSEHDARTSGTGWRRVGWNVSYTQSRIHHPPHMSLDSTYFTLSWSMQFQHHGDTCYLAHCYPYPLSALYRLLDNIEEDKERAKFIRKEVNKIFPPET